MKLLSSLIGSIVLLATVTGALAATTPLPAQAPMPAEALPVPAPVAPVSTLKLDDYVNELASALKLTDDEKKAIASFYQADGTQLQTLLNSETISPLDQDRQVTDLRDARNAKIKELLGSSDRIAAFLKIEAKYRVALIELAIDGGLVPPAPAADTTAAPAPASKPAPAPASTPAPAPAAAPTAPASAQTPPPE